MQIHLLFLFMHSIKSILRESIFFISLCFFFCFPFSLSLYTGTFITCNKEYFKRIFFFPLCLLFSSLSPSLSFFVNVCLYVLFAFVHSLVFYAASKTFVLHIAVTLGIYKISNVYVYLMSH